MNNNKLTSHLRSSMVLFVGALDSTLVADGSRTQRFLECVRSRAIPHYLAGAVMDVDGSNEMRNLTWTADKSYVAAVGETAAKACLAQGVPHESFPDVETDDPLVWDRMEKQLDTLASRLPLDRYRYEAIREQLFNLGYKAEWEWAQSVRPPETADDFAAQAIWVICCSGFREQAARVTEEKALQALAAGRSATEVFPSSGKGRAIDTLWLNRDRYFADFQALLAANATAEEIVAWIAKAKLPYVGGGILRYHFAKNLGVDLAKPDRHLVRVLRLPENGPAEHNFTAAMELCRSLAQETGDRIATVDLVIWRACNLGILDSIAARNRTDTRLSGGESAC